MFWKKKTSNPEKLLSGQNEIKKCLYAFLINAYSRQFPNESENTIFLKTVAVLNELVLFENGQEDQLIFRKHNRQFVDNAKIEVMKIEEFRVGILSFLVIKGALCKLYDRPNADKWINEAKGIDPQIRIPSNLEEVEEEINRRLLYYQFR